MTIILLGIVAVAAVPQFNFDDAERGGFYDEVAAAARYGQKLAVASGCPVQLRISAAGYALWQESVCDGGDFSRAVDHPARSEQFARAAPAGISLAGGTVVFLANGSSTGGTVTVGSRSFTVHTTGYVDD